jgi:PAS domain S-box-containing protein
MGWKLNLGNFRLRSLRWAYAGLCAFLGAILVNQDISARVKVEETLKRAYKELTASNEKLEVANRELQTRIMERTTAYLEANARLEALNAELQKANTELAQAKLDLEWDLAERERITDQLKVAFETLGEREQQLRTVLQALPVGLWLSDAEGQITYSNPAAQRIWSGVEPLVSGKLREYKGRRADTGEWFDLEEEVIFRVLRTGTAMLNETMDIEDQDGNHIIIQISAVPVLGEGGSVLGVVVVNEDVTEQRKAEGALRTYATRLERSNQDLEHFAFIASHDLQEPLRKVRSFGELLKADFNPILGERGRDYLLRMQDAAWRMQLMINDLLTYSRASTRPNAYAQVDLSAVAQVVLQDLESLLERTGGAVELDVLPTIEADPTQMHQLLLNLIGNALKFHREGVPPRVYVYSQVGVDVAKTVNLFIEDNGIGFDLQHLERMFQPFQRLHGRTEFEGSGIGLAICRRIVERHGGSISATSAPGEGSTFVVTLPLKAGI